LRQQLRLLLNLDLNLNRNLCLNLNLNMNLIPQSDQSLFRQSFATLFGSMFGSMFVRLGVWLYLALPRQKLPPGGLWAVEWAAELWSGSGAPLHMVCAPSAQTCKSHLASQSLEKPALWNVTSNSFVPHIVRH